MKTKQSQSARGNPREKIERERGRMKKKEAKRNEKKERRNIHSPITLYAHCIYITDLLPF